MENDRAARAQNDLQLRLQREAGVLEQRKLQAGMEENASWTGCGTPMA
ncbi:MAG: hypothetical protein ACLR1T_01530 [Evtepia gabavorous]